MKLWYLIVGTRTGVMSVNRKSSDDVSDLLGAIKASNSSMFAGVDDLMIKLYAAKQNNGRWLDADGPQVVALMAGDKATVDIICQTSLNQQDLLEQHFRSLETRKIHLLVRVVDAGKPLRQLITANNRPRFVMLWCLIVGDTDRDCFAVVVKASDCIHDLQKAIKKELFDSNPLIRAIALQLYEARIENGAWLARSAPEVRKLQDGDSLTIQLLLQQQELDPASLIDETFRTSKDGRLNVLVVLPQTFVVAEDKEHWHHTQHYRAVAEILKNTKKVDEVVQQVEQISRTGARNPYKAPFIALVNSSGSGKTQMAFNLMTREETKLFYISCGEDVELGYSRRASAFLRCVAADLPSLENAGMFSISKVQESYTFGFIEALLSGKATFAQLCTRRKVMNAVKKLEEGDKRCVFFLDNFPDSTRCKHCEHSERDLRLMVNVFRSLGLAVIVSSRSCVCSEIVRSDQRYVKQQEYDVPSCIVMPSLPCFRNISSTPMQRDIQAIIKHSRPMFANAVMKYATENPLKDDAKLVRYLDEMVKELANKFANSEKFMSEFFRMGQVYLFLGGSYFKEDPSCKMVRDDIKRHLITDHFAHFYEFELFQLWFPWHFSPTDQELSTAPVWECNIALPKPDQDALLHLCLTSSKDFIPLRDVNMAQIPFCKAFASVESNTYVYSITANNAFYYPSKNMRLEMVVAGAVIIASHRNGLAGIVFADFFSSLLYELGMQSTLDQRIEFPESIQELVSSFTVPYLAPPNLEWPGSLMRSKLNLGMLGVERAKDGTDIKLGGGISIECNWQVPTFTHYNFRWFVKKLDFSIVWSILERVPSESSIHLVITQRLPKSDKWIQDSDWKNRVFTILEGLKYSSLHHVHIFPVCSFPSSSNDEDKGDSPAVVAVSYAGQCNKIDCSKCKLDKLVLFLQVLNEVPNICRC
ncbi:hypothetical protein F441_03489 [Phytophthora nicotianae CJ01A1]|uniref:Crinkler effector protein N-terminal domain-containing protein n=1 Tax=Phytophthora nicotianae CJ01A1 TaxID=1317063 RepID=W2XKJ8_PHYNI|nr:hypothetical protein F441_03489 [Phytophthora nicotianae CJ01A1]